MEGTDPVVTDQETNLNTNSVTLNGESYEAGDVYFKWRETGASTWNTTSNTTQGSAGTFSKDITGLSHGVQYEFKAMLDYNGDTYDGDTLTFTTMYGKISGIVQKSGTDIDGATVRIINQSDSSYTTTLTTSADGTYEYLISNSTDANKSYHVIVEYEDGDGKWNALSKWDVDPTNLS